jgi:VanZ family protein
MPRDGPTQVANHNDRMTGQRPGSSAVWLALAYAVLVLYASLYPFEGWRWPPGQTLWTLAALPRSVYQDPFDVYSNLLGYLPLGALLGVALYRPGAPPPVALMLSVVIAATLSYGCELLQHFVPRRVPALEDLGMNTGGALLGALLGLGVQALGWVQRWHRLRERWFGNAGTPALGLLGLWPLGLLFPAPVPLGLGQVGERLREWAATWLEGVPWAEAAHALLAQGPTTVTPLRPLAEVLIVAVGLLAPCLVAYTAMAPGLRRVVVALGALALAALAMTASTWLNFGPRHALAWLTPLSGPGLMLGLLLALLAALLPRRLVPGLGLVVLTGLVVGVAQAPADPYFAQSLQAWEQGRFVRFHGLAQWIGWLWPYGAMGWLLSRLGARNG